MLHDVYTPLLGLGAGKPTAALSDAVDQPALEPRLQELLLQLQAGLGSAARGAGGQVMHATYHSRCAPFTMGGPR